MAMGKSWTLGADAICFYEMKEFNRRLQSTSMAKGRFGELFSREMEEKYPVLSGHGQKGVFEHFEHLLGLAEGTVKNTSSKNECYRHIFNSENESINGPGWTKSENAICFYELKEYKDGLDSCEEPEVEEYKRKYTKRLTEQYGLLSKKDPDRLADRLDELYRIATVFGSRLSRNEDQVYLHIFQEDQGEASMDKVQDNQAGSEIAATIEIVESDINEKMTLTDDQQQSLLSFIGYGDIGNVDIAFFMNEGGLGQQSLEDNIELLCNQYKAGNTNWKDGYWKTDEWMPGNIRKVPDSPFLKLSSRMILALEDKENPVENWFQKGDGETGAVVKTFMMENGLYSNRPGIKSALFDWRPLPRRSEKEVLPYQNLDGKKYLDAFSFKRSETPYSEWVDQRVRLFKNHLTENEVPILLSFGAVGAKLKLFKHIWDDIQFEKITLPESGKTIHVSSKIGKNTTVIASEFLDYQNLGYRGASELTEYIRRNFAI